MNIWEAVHMPAAKLVERMELPVLLIVVGRLLGCLALLLVGVVGGGVAGLGVGPAVGAGLFAAMTILWAVAASRDASSGFSALAVFTVLCDSVGLCLLTSGVDSARDPFYAWYISEVVLMTLAFKERWALALALPLSISYIAGHLLAGGLSGPLDAVFLMIGAATIAASAVFVVLIMGEIEKRSEALELQRARVEELNAELARSVSELRAVTSVSDLVHSTLEVERIGPALLEVMKKVIGAPAAAFYVIDRQRQARDALRSQQHS